MKLEHKLVPGYDFMPENWCGACETCNRMSCPDVCLGCSYTRRGYPKDRPATYYCRRAPIKPGRVPALIHDGRKP